MKRKGKKEKKKERKKKSRRKEKKRKEKKEHNFHVPVRKRKTKSGKNHSPVIFLGQ